MLRLVHPSITHRVSVIQAAGIFDVAHILRAPRCTFDGCKRARFI
jgi:hypothetical protein